MTNYVNINKSANLSDAPRKLTTAEIKFVTDQIPLPLAADKLSAQVAKQDISELIGQLLAEQEVCPSGIQELITEISNQHYRSLISPGTTIGITAAEAVGASTTQATLNSFHLSGSVRSATASIDAMRELIFARAAPKHEISTIFYSDKHITLEEVLESRRYIVGSVIADFISDYEIKPKADLQQYWWHDPVIFSALTAKDRSLKLIPNSDTVMRIQLNLVEMYKHRVTIEKLASILENDTPQLLIAVYGPISDGIIDLYPDPQIIRGTVEKFLDDKVKMDQGLLETTYLETIVYPELAKIRVKGILGITEIYPQITKVWTMVNSEKATGNNNWDLFFNKVVMHNTGLISDNLEILCENAGLLINSVNDDGMNVQMPNDQKPSEYIAAQIAKSREDFEESTKVANDAMLAIARKIVNREERRKMIRTPIVLERPALIKASEYVTAETDGSNLKDLLKLSCIDKTRTTSNNMHEVANIFGIEAARVFLIKAFSDVINNSGSYVHPSNLLFIAEFIMSRGEPYGATYTGISRQPGGHLSLASLERASKVFTSSALHGKDEDIRGVSASIVVGARSAIGDGIFDVGFDFNDNGVVKTYINDETSKPFIERLPTRKIKFQANNDIQQGLDDLANTNIGLELDVYAEEDKTNMQNLFRGEVIQDLSRITKFVDIPAPIADELSIMKVGPINTRVTFPPSVPVKLPMIATGLMVNTQFVKTTMNTGLSDNLLTLMRTFAAIPAVNYGENY